MIQVCWRTFRRALPICAAWWIAMGAAVGVGYAAGQADPVPPASAVTAAPSGFAHLGRAPEVQRTLETQPPVTAKASKKPPRDKPRRSGKTSTPTPSASPSPEPSAASGPASSTPEPGVSPSQ